MVLSMGWNPFYGNTKKSFETHIIHNFEKDFYGSELIVVMLGYLRPEKNYDSLDLLKGKLGAARFNLNNIFRSDMAGCRKCKTRIGFRGA